MNARGVPSLTAAALVVLTAARAGAEPDSPGTPGVDRFELLVRGETHAQLFRRALLPGPNGSLVFTQTVLPIQQYVLLTAREIDAPWRKDSVDIELSAWGQTTIGDPSPERAVDGDVQTANVGYRQGPLHVRLGRQHVAGGAARYARFDGGNVEVELGEGFDVAAYGGFTALPRWDARPGYYMLGAAADGALKDLHAVSAPSRSSTWLTGGRVGYRSRRARAGLSFHEERTGGWLGRRSLATDAQADLASAVAVAGSALLDVDQRHLADARLSADFTPLDALDLTAEYLHAEPALLLSRQSVLSVFSTASYDELGGYVTLRAARSLRFESSGFFDVYDEGRPGARAEVAVRALPGLGGDTVARLAYGRLLGPDNGYHSARLSLTQRFFPKVSGTLDGYGYFYDAPIRGVRVSTIYAGTLTFQAEKALSVLVGASFAHSPYARLDAEGQVRLAYAFDLSREGAAR